MGALNKHLGTHVIRFACVVHIDLRVLEGKCFFNFLKVKQSRRLKTLFLMDIFPHTYEV